MRIALVHDYIKEYGGAERVLEALHELYPEADVYTSVYLPGFLGPHRERFKSWKIKTSFLQHVPFKHKLISPFRILSPFVFKSFDFSRYDVIITSATGAYFPNSLDKKKAKLLCYCHTPPRYLYGYATAREWKKNVVLKVLGEIANHFLRLVDFNAAQNVDQFIANSEEVKARIKKFYRKDAVVVYPPVDLASSKLGSSVQIERKLNASQLDAKCYFLAGGRLARPKHIDLIVKTCAKHDIPLKVFGKAFAGYGEELRALANGVHSTSSGSSKWHMANGEKKPLVEIVGEVSDEEKSTLLANAKAYIMASVDEDFGILPVEAMAAGTPVISYRSGGVKETVVDGKTGVFFDELTEESLMKAIKLFSNITISAHDCQKQAEKFSKERFMRAIKEVVET